MRHRNGLDDPATRDGGFALALYIPWPLSAFLLAALALGVGYAAYCVFTGGVERTSWKLTEAAAGAELHIGVFVGGCDRFKRISLAETDQAVVIKAYIRKDVRNQCDEILNEEPKTVQLSVALGDRSLRGCNPSNSAYPESGYSDDDCADTHPH